MIFELGEADSDKIALEKLIGTLVIFSVIFQKKEKSEKSTIIRRFAHTAKQSSIQESLSSPNSKFWEIRWRNQSAKLSIYYCHVYPQFY